MDERLTAINGFLTACDELINGTYVLADVKISEVLKSIAGSKDLTDLFSAVTERFDYPKAKQLCLRFPAAKGAAHGAAFLPSERGEVLAFVFCLLVEFDGGAVRLNDFLLRYFYDDGSYTASFSLFADRMLRPFRDIVAGCFPEACRAGNAFRYLEKEGSAMEAIASRVNAELSRLAGLQLSEPDRKAGGSILSEMLAAAGRLDTQEVKALACGYFYFLRAVGAGGEEAEALFSLVNGL